MTTKTSLHAHMMSLPSSEAHIGLRAQPAYAEAGSVERKGRRIWELSGTFHCSVIGTCLTTRELRQILIKLQMPGVEKETDHELHGRAVLLAGKRDQASKLLHKALDRRHRAALSRFAKARTTEELRLAWLDAVQQADIPGGYWAVLTHPLTTEDLAREAFGEVHMLSHLVGAANRADIRRLRELEAQNASLQEKLARQQRHLRDAIVSRDATITNLRNTLGRAIARSRSTTGPRADDEGDAAAGVIHDLRRRLAREATNRKRLEQRLQRVAGDLDCERQRRAEAEKRGLETERELASADLLLAGPKLQAACETDRAVDLSGASILYVGGRPHTLAQLRTQAENCGASFLHHDGGVDDRSGLLASLVARADTVFFPVDCVSHNAVAVVKRIARQHGKPYVALRTAGLSSFVAALGRLADSYKAHDRRELQTCD